MAEQHRPTVMVWGSGSGTTFRAIAEALRSGLVDFDISTVITDRSRAGILDQVREVNSWLGRDSQIETRIINKTYHPGGPQERGQTQEEAEATCRLMQASGSAVLLLAGCTRILGDQVLDEYGWKPEWKGEPSWGLLRPEMRIINTHPGIIPETADTYGVGASRRVIDLELERTACTLLAVGGSVDGGPIIAQHQLDVPTYNVTDEASRNAAAEHLFKNVVQPAEKAFLPFDVEDFVYSRSIAA